MRLGPVVDAVEAPERLGRARARPRVDVRIFASSSLSITGKSSDDLAGVLRRRPSSRLRSGPSDEPSEVTTSSRIESSGGFVTCANCCVK